MFKLKHCMVVLDPASERQNALDSALCWSVRERMEFELVVCDGESTLDPGYYYYEAERIAPKKAARDARLTAFLESHAQRLKDHGLSVKTRILEGHPVYESIVRYVANRQPDAVFQSASYHSRLDSLYLSNRDWQIVRACPAPLLLSKRPQWSVSPIIIATIDPLHSKDEHATLDRQILYAAKHAAALFDAHLHVFHSYNQVLLAGAPLQESRQLHEQKCFALLDSVDIARDRLRLEELPVHSALPLRARELKADLVIMGAVSRSRLGDIFIGNTAEQVLDELESDVLIIKPEGFNSPVLALPNPRPAGDKPLC